MKRILLGLLALILVPFMLQGQTKPVKEIAYKIGTPYKHTPAYTLDYFEHEGNVIAVKLGINEIIIQKINANTLKIEGVQTYKDLPKGYVKEGLKSLNGNLYLFYSYWDKSKVAFQLFSRKIDFEKGIFVEEGKHLIEAKGKLGWSMETLSMGYSHIGVYFRFEIIPSADNSKLLIRYHKSGLDEEELVDEHKRIYCHVYDENLEEIWANKIKMPYHVRGMKAMEYAVDANANVYVLAAILKNDNKKKYNKDGSNNFDVELFRIDATTQKLQQTKIDTKGKFINQIKMGGTSSGAMICAGFYDEEGAKSSETIGIFSAQINKDASFDGFSTYEIPDEILNYYPETKKKKKISEFQNLEIRNLLLNKDGSILLIGEQYYSSSTTRTESTGTSVSSSATTTYRNNDMLMTKINANGSLAWIKKLPKRQSGIEKRGEKSFKHLIKDDNHYLLFLDSEDNRRLGLNVLPDYHNLGEPGIVTAYKVNDNSGDVSKISSLKLGEVRKLDGKDLLKFSVDRLLRISDNELLIEFYKKKKENVLVKFTIN